MDVKKGQAYDMLADSGIYATLLKAALSGKILAILGGPNCRSRSVLRHQPIEGFPWAPRPVRVWKEVWSTVGHQERRDDDPRG